MENIDFKKNFNKFLTENTKPNPRSAEELRRIIRESILEKKDEEEVVDAEVETTDAPAEPAMDATETETTSDLEGDARTVQDDLEKALEGAKSMGDDKLINQIENTITFLIRSQHSVTEQAEDDDYEPSELNMQFHMALSELIQEYSEQGLSNGEILDTMDIMKEEWDNMPTDSTQTQIKK